MYKFVELLADVVEANILIVFVGIFTVRGRIEKHWKQMLGFAVGMGCMCFLLDQIVLVSWLKAIVIMILYILICKWMYKTSMQRIVVTVVSYSALIVIFEFIVVVLLNYITGADVSKYMEVGIERSTALIIMKIVEIFIMCLLYRLSSNQTMAIVSKKMTVMVMSICVVIIFMTVFFVSHYIKGSYIEISVLFYLVLSLSVVLCVIYFMFIAAADMDRQQQLEMIKLQNTLLQKSIEETKHSYTYWERHIHDYKNIVLCLNSMLESQDYISVCEYLKEEIKQIQKEHHVVNSGNTLVDSVLSAKWLVADDNHVFFSIQGKVDKELPIPEIPFGRIMGNLVDNAIEGATSYSYQPYVEVVMCQTEWMLSLEISNSAEGKKVDFGNSSKKEKWQHGIGLKSVREIVEEYDGFFEIRQIKDRVVAKVELFMMEDFG
jgi:hypothetical protein